MIVADDYGLGDQHDQVMRGLLAGRAIDAVSVLVEHCSEASAQALRAHWQSDARVGLHINLTLAPAGTPPRPGRGRLLLRSALGLGRITARDRLQTQWARFHELFDRPPDFLDGHEHCHAFPGIRSEVVALAARANLPVRSMVPPTPPADLKARVIAHLGSQMQSAARARGVLTNDWFLGALPLDKPQEALRALAVQIDAAERLAAQAQVWMMVHPGSAQDPNQVPGHAPALRALEADFLRSRNR